MEFLQFKIPTYQNFKDTNWRNFAEEKSRVLAVSPCRVVSPLVRQNFYRYFVLNRQCANSASMFEARQY